MDRRSLIRNAGIAGVLAVVMLVVAAAPVFADTFVCTGNCSFGPNDVLDNLEVKNGGVATLNGTRVNGNIVVKNGGKLYLKNGAEVEGNVQSEEGAGRVDVRDSFVDGDIQIKQTKRIVVKNTIIDGNLQLQENNAKYIDTVLNGNFIGGDLQLDKNKFTNRKAKINGNDVFGNLQLVDNDNGIIIVKNNFVESALQCDDNDSQITGFGNDAGDLECPFLD